MARWLWLSVAVLALDQIMNNAASIPHMSGGQFAVPLVIRMATGARKLNILLQFNTEALVVCAAGGVAGVILGLATTWTFSYFGKPVEYTVGPVALAFSCAFATGLLFGYLPARKAATLDPLTALGAP